MNHSPPFPSPQQAGPIFLSRRVSNGQVTPFRPSISFSKSWVSPRALRIVASAPVIVPLVASENQKIRLLKNVVHVLTCGSHVVHCHYVARCWETSLQKGFCGMHILYKFCTPILPSNRNPLHTRHPTPADVEKYQSRQTTSRQLLENTSRIDLPKALE